MPTISAVIIVRNEERNIRNCLGTVKWCDEIVVVDMDSTDRTVSIAKEFTSKIHTHPVILAFDRAKKYAVDHASGDWILLIDADEMVPPALATALRSISREDTVDIVEIPFQHYILGAWVRYTGWGYTPLPRFFRKGRILFSETVHKYMRPVAGAGVRRLEPTDDNCISHFNYTDSTHFVNKLNRYTTIEAQHLYDRNVPFSSYRLLTAMMREFIVRYIVRKGYREGPRGLSLAIMMAFYRGLSYIKLWEHSEYKDDPVEQRYDRIRSRIISEWDKRGHK